MIEITESLVVRLAGVREFGRGLSQYEAGSVLSVVTTGNTTQAVVQDPENHNVVLRHSQLRLEGECDCEVSDGLDFCRHCVAVALRLQDQCAQQKPVSKRQAMSVIRRHMAALSHEELLGQYMALIEQDRKLRDRLLRKAEIASGRLSFTALRSMIQRIELDGEPWETGAIRAFSDEFEAMLLSFREIADRIDSLVLLRAVEFAVQHLNEEIRFIDAHEDYWDDSQELIFDLYLGAVNRLDWSPTDRDGYLDSRSESDAWHPAQWIEKHQEVR